MSVKLELPENIDDEIIQLVRANPKLTQVAVIRDIARLFCILNLVDQGVLDEKTVVCGGMALRCYHSERLSIYDTDTSTASEQIDRQRLARALDYADDDISISAASPGEWDYRLKLITAQPITYTPFFTTLDAGDTTFALTISNRGLERDGIWRKLITGYSFIGVPEGTRIPVMDLHEILAEKLVSWWLFGHAKHYADIGWIASLLNVAKRQFDPEVRADVRWLVERKLAINDQQHHDRVQELTLEVRRSRLVDPASHIAPNNNWDKVSYLGTKQWRIDQVKLAVEKAIIPLLFDAS